MAGVLWSEIAEFVCVIGGFWVFLFVYSSLAILLFIMKDEYHLI